MTWKQTGNIILVILIGAAMVFGLLLLPGWQITLILGVITVAEGIRELVSALLLRRGIAGAGRGWVNPPQVKAW